MNRASSPPALSSIRNGGEGARRAEEEVLRFMVTMRDSEIVEAFHEPCLLSPALSSIRNGGEGARRAGEEVLRFMVTMRDLEIVEAPQEPAPGSAGVSPARA